MAADNFATMNRRKTNKIAFVLLHALLEWILLSLLLSNSLFSYMIRRFADYFGLKRPCLLCSSIDHVFDREKKQNWSDLLCDGHGMEISKLGFSCNHREVVGSENLCRDCSSSGEMGSIEFCSCCGVRIESQISEISQKSVSIEEEDAFHPQISESSQKSVSNEEEEEEDAFHPQISEISQKSVSNEEENAFFHTQISEISQKSVLNEGEEDAFFHTQISETSQKSVSNEGEEDAFHPQISDFSQKSVSIEGEDFPSQVSKFSQKIYSIEDEGFHKEAQISDSVLEVSSQENQNENYKEENLIKEEKSDDGFSSDHLEEEQRKKTQIEVAEMIEEDEEEEEYSCFISSLDCKKQEQEVELVIEENKTDESVVANHFEFYIDQQDCHLIPVGFYGSGEDEPHGLSENNGDLVMDFDVQEILQSDFVLGNNQTFEETAIILSSDELDPKNNGEMLEIAELDMNKDREEEEETNTEAVQVQASYSDNGILQTEDGDEADEEISIGTEIPDQEQIDDHILIQQFASQTDNAEMVEETLEFMTFPTETQKIAQEEILETPQRFFYLERRESGREDCLDNASVTSEIECPYGVLTMETLKSELRKEREALTALYVELEEERNASAVAANQTMSMINRLQEEKAAMQMEALQYQRMMEEQSEFDQEALHLLNELLLRREKEKAELEKDLESYRKKVQEYESNEKLGILRRTSRNCSEDNGTEHTNTPAEAILGLDDTLSDFEEERFSILERLKGLEQKLFNLEIDDEEEDEKELENGNCHINENGNGHCRSNVISSKRLLPLFDAVDTEPQDGVSNGFHHENSEDDSEKPSPGEFENRIAIEEEVNELYVRLQVLEGEGEFLRHCISSLNKGDKGVCLLQQILRSLQDLRNTEIRVENSKDYGL